MCSRDEIRLALAVSEDKKHIGKLIFWHPRSTDISLSSAALSPNCEFITSLARCSAAGFVFTPSVRLPAGRFSSARWIRTRDTRAGEADRCVERRKSDEKHTGRRHEIMFVYKKTPLDSCYVGGWGERLLSRIILETRASSGRQRVFTHRFCYRTKRNRVHSTSVRSRF